MKMMTPNVALSITLLLCLFYTVQSQQPFPMSRTEKELRKNLTEIIQYIVHPNATISEDLVNFALATGREPQTQQERLTYLDLIKTIARGTPEFIKDFKNVVVLADGTKFESVDEMRFDKTITDRSLLYLKNGLPTTTVAPGNNMAPKTGTDSNNANTNVANTGAGTVNTNPIVGNANNVQNGQTGLFGQVPGTPEPMLSMFDVFQWMGGNNQWMGGNNQWMG
ncbi:hypothetical protein ACF0H5_020592 [Mactra antiquata]